MKYVKEVIRWALMPFRLVFLPIGILLLALGVAVLLAVYADVFLDE